ncbi:MAG TPA: hypothetical protein VEA69_25885 [Tepidisphaeraceae bacterium]|nr:hypothetical protein [Tepidisphaeraceae bacterium]
MSIIRMFGVLGAVAVATLCATGCAPHDRPGVGGLDWEIATINSTGQAVLLNKRTGETWHTAPGGGNRSWIAMERVAP